MKLYCDLTYLLYTGVGGWLDPLGGWTPGPTILGQLDRGSNHPAGQLDPPLDGWTHRRMRSPPKAPTPHVLDMSKTPTRHRQKCQRAIV